MSAARSSVCALAILLFFCVPLYAQGNDPSLVGLKHFPFLSSKGEKPLPPGLEGKPQKPGKPGYVIIKFKDKINVSDKARLAKAGVRIHGYVPVDALIARVPPGRRGEVESDPAVAAVYDYRPAYRLDGKLLDSVKKGERGLKRLLLQAFDGEDLVPIGKEIEKLGGSRQVEADNPGLNGKTLKVQIDASRLPDIAAIDGVLWVQEEEVPQIHNDFAAPVVGADYAWTGSLSGTGQIVAVCDTGLDTGNASTLHQDFAGTTSGGLPRLKQAFAYGRLNDWSDPDGHGTHTSGSAVGTGAKSNEVQPGTYVRGIANDAQIVFQSTLNSSGSLSVPGLNATVFPDAYGAGARVHSNSWGYQYSYGAYTISAVSADTYAWNNKDFLPLFSAGNDGADSSPADGVTDSGSVASPSTAKNVISVGASENDRSSIAMQYGTAVPAFTAPPISPDKMADNASGMAAFSGRGPCDDGRIKPDLTAPGTYVLSAKSSVGATGYTLASKYGYPTSFDAYYRYSSGTSMAAPLTAGSAALVRQFLSGVGCPLPSAALVKGILINGAFDMSPGQYASPNNDVAGRPDMSQGWGRVDLRESLFPAAPKRLLFTDNTQGLTTGCGAAIVCQVSDASVPVRVSLVWTDYPGSASTLPNLVNDLDLIVTVPQGAVYHGNRFSGSVSVPDDPAFDRLNNVEGVSIPASALSAGQMEVSVSGYNIPFGPQPYAVIISGGLSATDPPIISGVSPPSGPNDSATEIMITGSGFGAGASVLVGNTACQVLSLNATQITATAPSGLPPGPQDVTVTNTDLQSATLTAAFLVTTETIPPSAPLFISVSPGDSSINAVWSASPEPDVAGYRIFFGGDSADVGASTSRKLTGLTNGVSYDVSVKAYDVNGNVSPASPTASATPFAPQVELPHYSWDASPTWYCGSCHTESTGSGFLPADFNYRHDSSLCLSCHNAASVGHSLPIKQSSSHKILVNVTSGGARRPVYGTVTSGYQSDSMASHLKGGELIVCATCHNPMSKPNDSARSWESAAPSPDGRTFRPYRGGWWDQGYKKTVVYGDTTLGTPTYSKDREARRIDPGRYSFDEYSGKIVFENPTGGYIYFSLKDPYLRAPGLDNTECADCHTEATHKGASCLACHAAHNTENRGLVREKVKRTGGVYRDVVFKRLTGVNSFADGGAAGDGICVVCHETTLYHRRDGTGSATHADGFNYNGKDCSACHTHGSGFAK